MSKLTTPRALKTINPDHTPETKDAITYTGREMLGNANTGESHPHDTRRVATASHHGYAVIAVGDTTAILTPLQAEQLAEALQRHAKRARQQRKHNQ